MRFILILFFLAFSLAQAQLDDPEHRNYLRDSVCFKLKFNQGDTLVYQVISYDSIVVDYGTALLKSRTEKIQIICDSVSSDGAFFLSHTLIDFKSKEAERVFDDNAIERNKHEWVGKTVHLKIDSLGNRLSETPYQSKEAIQSPGGGFQPYLFFAFRESCKSVGESWLVDGTDELVENANPPAMLSYSALFRARDEIDTLGYQCNAFEYVKTGQGAIEAIHNKQLVKVSNVINSFGILYIDKEIFKPVHYYYTVEQKLKFHLEDNEEIPVQHFVTANFTLLEFRR